MNYYLKKQLKKIMTKDSVEVVIANAGGIGISLAGINDILTFVSLSLAIMFTIYKFRKMKNDE